MVTDLPPRVLGGGDVEVVRQPAPRELGIAGFLVEVVAAEPEGVVDRDPLGAEHGERVAETRGGLGVVAGQDGTAPVVELDDQRPRRFGAGLFLHAAANVTLRSANVTLPGHSVASRVAEPHHGAERAVAEPDQIGMTTGVSEVCGGHPLVLLEDDPVTDAERLGADPDLGTQLPGGLATGPDHLVERGDVGAADGQDGGGVGAMDAPPVLHDALAGPLDGAGDRHPAVFDVGVDSRGDVAVAEGDEGVAFPLLVRASLAAVGGQGDDMTAELVREGAQRPPASMEESWRLSPRRTSLAPAAST